MSWADQYVNPHSPDTSPHLAPEVTWAAIPQRSSATRNYWELASSNIKVSLTQGWSVAIFPDANQLVIKVTGRYCGLAPFYFRQTQIPLKLSVQEIYFNRWSTCLPSKVGEASALLSALLCSYCSHVFAFLVLLLIWRLRGFFGICREGVIKALSNL